MTKPRNQNYTYLTIGKYTFVLTDVDNRANELPQPDFRGTGRALVAIEVKDQAKEIKGRRGVEKTHHWSRVDKSLIGTSTLI